MNAASSYVVGATLFMDQVPVLLWGAVLGFKHTVIGGTACLLDGEVFCSLL